MKTLIYFSFMDNSNYVDMFELVLKSLLFNNYEGDILVITNLQQEINNKIQLSKNKLLFYDPSYNLNLGPFFNRFLIYKFPLIKFYDKIIYSDVDIIFNTNPNVLFDVITDNLIYATADDWYESQKLMNDECEMFGLHLLTCDEKKYIDKRNVLAMNAGFFGFTLNMINHFDKITEFCLINKFRINKGFDQPFFNVYLFRNNLINVDLSKFVTHSGFTWQNVKPILHFADLSKNTSSKIEKMNLALDNFYTKNKIYTL